MVNRISALPRRIVAASAILLLAACASTPIPNDKIAVATASVQRAEQAGAPEFSPVELAAARDKLTQADKAAAAGKSPMATQLAEEANIDAQLAEATAAQAKSRKAAIESDAGMAALRQESNRPGN